MRMLIKVVFICFVIAVLSVISYAQQGHKYVNGVIKQFGNGLILLSFENGRGCAACLCKNISYLSHISRDGAIHEEPAKETQVVVGKHATLLLVPQAGAASCSLPSSLPFVNVCEENMCVSQIIVEEYRK